MGLDFQARCIGRIEFMKYMIVRARGNDCDGMTKNGVLIEHGSYDMYCLKCFGDEREQV